ncbi:MAG: hypothetical protein IKJ45_13695, partial [Kiritimatiellae bacterium]|nr:hypothetical protein [Kiritimatiellia bacterium]
IMGESITKAGVFMSFPTYRAQYNIVRNALQKLDPCALLAQGAPEDEFDTEAHEISRIINFKSSPRNIAEAFAIVLNNAFNWTNDASDYLFIAEEVYTNLQSIE